VDDVDRLVRIHDEDYLKRSPAMPATPDEPFVVFNLPRNGPRARIADSASAGETPCVATWSTFQSFQRNSMNKLCRKIVCGSIVRRGFASCRGAAGRAFHAERGDEKKFAIFFLQFNVELLTMSNGGRAASPILRPP
jgi:hypothetical protein